MTVTDEVGGVCRDSILVSVGNPEVTITSPTDGESYEKGEAILFSAAVFDAQDNPEDLEIEWSSDVDGVFNTNPADSSGNIAFNYSGLSAEDGGTEHLITLSATGTDGLSTTEEVNIIVSPPEVCDEIDNDGDGVVDEGVTTTYYADSDGDGYGDVDNTTEDCSLPGGYSKDNTDCDDTNFSLNPAATEVCDSLDNDCDGYTDDGDGSLDASTGATWYADSDGDGYGNAANTTQACTRPSGYVLDDTDCDDNEVLSNPGEIEVCDGLDNNCDGALDEDSAVDAATWYADTDGDSYGSTSSPQAACTQPSGYVADDTDCDDSDALVNPAATEYCDGVNNDCDSYTDESSAADASTWYRDSDGDGYGDAAISILACDRPSGYVADDTDCDDSDITLNPDTVWYADSDGDGYGSTNLSQAACSQPSGYVLDNTDCDDFDTTTSPAATEYCDGMDNDCDGTTDENDAADASTWYRDSDTDGYGNTAISTLACDQPAGYVSNNDDCNDGSATVSPADTEICDASNVDEDCDGLADDSDSSATGKSTWYRDADGDSYGTSATTVSRCDQPSGYVANSTDCDDSDATLNPDTVWYADSDGDGYGNSSSTIISCAQPSGYVADNTDCDDAESAANPGKTEVCNDGIDNDCDGTSNNCGVTGTIDLSTADAKLTGEAVGDYAGIAISGAGDVDGDGVDDLLVGAYGEDSGGSLAGAAYLVLGPVSGTQSLSAADAKLMGEAAGDYAGWAVSGAGDLNNDGYDDLLVGTYYNDAGGTDAGAAYLVLGPVSGTQSLSAADAKLTGEAADDHAGWSVSNVGDINLDSYDDFSIGAMYEDSGATNAGAAYLVLGPVSSGTSSLSTADAKLTGEAADDDAGWSVSGAGDLNNDGYNDLLVGTYGEDSGGSNAGAAYLVLGPVSGSQSLSTADAKLVGEASDDFAGIAVGAGDVDNDGYDDLLVGARGEDSGGTNAGAAYLVLGPVSGSVDLSTADAKLTGEAAYDYAGWSVSKVGDINLDSYDDFLIGALYEDSGGSNAGAAYLVLGPVSSGTSSLSTADAKLVGEASGDYAGRAVAGAGDVDSDGYNDLLVGAHYNDAGGSSAGAAYLIFGGGL
ncbi:MAG: FG-GAP repeat protein [Deltaproteobacteria bacterium]|nr:FG-GAP repeat protein [Deltaproteobacteria bacterium]